MGEAAAPCLGSQPVSARLPARSETAGRSSYIESARSPNAEDRLACGQTRSAGKSMSVSGCCIETFAR